MTFVASLTKFEIGAIICIIHSCDLLQSFDVQIIFNRNNFTFFLPLFLMIFVSDKKSLTLCQLIKSRK